MKSRIIKITGTIFILLFKTIANAQQFTNPILAGFYPDPSICKVNKDYYLVNSSFAYYPGIPIFHSKDLLNWKQIGHVMDRLEQLNLDSAGVSRGLFAPTIRYYKGLYYVICTLVDRGGNFIVTTKNPKGPWSNPCWFPQIDGIDPSIYFEDDKAYIFYNSIPPDNLSLYDGHRTIRRIELDYKKMQLVGENKIVINGGTVIAKKPVWIEGPHVFKKDGWYYLICAEGGTAYEHSEVVFRSKTLDGEFVSYEKNPILTQRHLDRSRSNPIINTGHADFVEMNDGKWFAVFLGCRPYEEEYFNTGRETFMAPVEWKNDWPIINPDFAAVQYNFPIDAKITLGGEKFSGNYLFKDDFNNATLNYRYSLLRTPREKWYDINKGELEMQLRPQTCRGFGNPSFVGFRQPHTMGYAATAMRFTAKSANEKAGLLVFQNDQHYYFICQSIGNGKPVVQLYKSNTQKNKPEELIIATEVKNTTEIFFKIEAIGSNYSFYYATKKNNWRLLKSNVDGKFLSTTIAGGFVGSYYAMYATSNGEASSNKVLYNWFECKSNDTVYKK